MTPPGEMISPGPLKVKEERFRIRLAPDTEPLFFDPDAASRTLFEKTGEATDLFPYKREHCEQGFDKHESLWRGWGEVWRGAGEAFLQKGSPAPLQFTLLRYRYASIFVPRSLR